MAVNEPTVTLHLSSAAFCELADTLRIPNGVFWALIREQDVDDHYCRIMHARRLLGMSTNEQGATIP